MELHKIERLLEKYFEATTTVAEEETLKKYFSQKDVAPHLAQYASMFNYFSDAKKEAFTNYPEFGVAAQQKKNRYRWIAAVAAVLAPIAIGIGIYSVQVHQERQQAEYAYTETKKALNMLAENFGRGAEKVAYLKEFETTKQKIYKNN